MHLPLLSTLLLLGFLAVPSTSHLLFGKKLLLAKKLLGEKKEDCHVFYEDKTTPHCSTTYEQVGLALAGFFIQFHISLPEHCRKIFKVVSLSVTIDLSSPSNARTRPLSSAALSSPPPAWRRHRGSAPLSTPRTAGLSTGRAVRLSRRGCVRPTTRRSARLSFESSVLRFLSVSTLFPYPHRPQEVEAVCVTSQEEHCRDEERQQCQTDYSRQCSTELRPVCRTETSQVRLHCCSLCSGVLV